MFSNVKLSFGPFQVQRSQRWKPPSVFYHFQRLPFMPNKKKAVWFPFKWSPERSRSTSPFTARPLCKFAPCSSMEKEQKRWAAKRVLPGSRAVLTAEGCSGLTVGPLWERAAKWVWAPLFEAALWAAAPALPARFYTVHISCKLAFTGPGH